MNLPKQYQFLAKLQGPKTITESLKFYGLKEIVGKQHNSTIVNMADAIGIPKLVNDDEQAWCGLFAAYIATRAQKFVPMKQWDILRALKWLDFGRAVKVPGLGDVMVFGRDGGGHVAFYVGEDKSYYHVIGGNQSNMVNITRIAKSRLVGIRRPIYVNQPAEVKQIFLSAEGPISSNEA